MSTIASRRPDAARAEHLAARIGACGGNGSAGMDRPSGPALAWGFKEARSEVRVVAFSRFAGRRGRLSHSTRALRESLLPGGAAVPVKREEEGEG